MKKTTKKSKKLSKKSKVKKLKGSTPKTTKLKRRIEVFGKLVALNLPGREELHLVGCLGSASSGSY